MTPQQPFAWRALRRGATCVLAAAAVTAAFSMPPASLPVRAHDHWDWIRQGDFRDVAGQPCCDVKDCKMIPATSGDVVELANGSFQYMPTGEVIPAPRHEHRRIRTTGAATGMKTAGR